MAQSTAGERTEQATPKRRQKEREEGNVARSTDLTSALVLLGTLLVSRAFIASAWRGVINIWQTDLAGLPSANWTQATVMSTFSGHLWLVVRLFTPLLVLPMFIGIVLSYTQVRFMFVPKLLLPRFDRLNPLRGLKHMFGLRGLGQGVSSMLKLAVVGLVVYFSVRGMRSELASLSQVDVMSYASTIGQVVFSVLLRVTIGLVIVGGLDYLYQRYTYERNIKMTKQELREEYKEAEGDPQIKQQIRKRGRQIAQRRMMEKVKTADLVVANPTHVSIALVYEMGNAAPVVVAKGQEEVALRIRAVATNHDVPIIENKPLAWDLYRTCELDEPIPARLFAVVAQLLAQVYRLKGKQIKR